MRVDSSSHSSFANAFHSEILSNLIACDAGLLLHLSYYHFDLSIASFGFFARTCFHLEVFFSLYFSDNPINSTQMALEILGNSFVFKTAKMHSPHLSFFGRRSRLLRNGSRRWAHPIQVKNTIAREANESPTFWLFYLLRLVRNH